jgi:hypothetical protein
MAGISVWGAIRRARHARNHTDLRIVIPADEDLHGLGASGWEGTSLKRQRRQPRPSLVLQACENRPVRCDILSEE